MSPKLVTKKSLLIAFFIFITIEISLAAPVVFSNTNETEIILHPSETHVYYHINTSIHSLTPVEIESTYIVLSGIIIQIDASAYTDVYINSFQPEHIAVPNATIINITVAPKYHGTMVNFYFGNLTEVPLIVYKDGEPYLVAIPNEYREFVGNVSTYRSENTLSFFDGDEAINYIRMQSKSASEIKEITVGEHVIVTGRVINVTTDIEEMKLTLSDPTGTVEVELPIKAPVEIEESKEVVVFGYVRDGKVVAHKVMLKQPSGFSAHTYEIKTLAGAELGVLAAPPEEIVPDLSEAINYASYTIAGITVLLSIMLIVRKLKGV